MLICAGNVFSLFMGGQASDALRAFHSIPEATALASDLRRVANRFQGDPFVDRFVATAKEIDQVVQTLNPRGLSGLGSRLSVFFGSLEEPVKKRIVAELNSGASHEKNRLLLTAKIREGRWQEVEKLLEAHPLEVVTEFYLLQTHFFLSLEKQNFKGAKGIIKKMFSLYPNSPEAHLCDMERALVFGATIIAREIAEKMSHYRVSEPAVSGPKYDYFCSMSVRILLAEGNVEEAQFTINDWYLYGDPQTLAERYYLQGLIDSTPSLGREYDPISSLEKAVLWSPTRADFQLALARAYFKAKEVAKATAVLSEIEKLDPLSVDIWAGLASLYQNMGEMKSEASAHYRMATILKLRGYTKGAIFAAGTAFALAHVVDDIDLMLQCDRLLCQMAVLLDPSLNEGRIPAQLSIYHEIAAAKKARIVHQKEEAFSDQVLMYGLAFQTVHDLFKPLLQENIELFFEICWNRGIRLFGEPSFENGMEFLSLLKKSIRVSAYARGEEWPEEWSPEVAANVIMALSLLFKEGNYSLGARFSREMISAFQMKMYPQIFADMNQWYIRFCFYQAFQETGIEDSEIREALDGFRRMQSERERLIYVEVLVRRYDNRGLSQVGDRLLTLGNGKKWANARSTRSKPKPKPN